MVFDKLPHLVDFLMEKIVDKLVGGINPSEKYACQIGSFPLVWVKSLKPPVSYLCFIFFLYFWWVTVI